MVSGATPWTRWMQIGLGIMGLPASAFWALSLREWTLALEGRLEARGVAIITPLTRRELDGLVDYRRRRTSPAEHASLAEQV